MDSVLQVIAKASNIRTGENPPYTVESFLQMYPQFVNVPQVVLEAWVKMAHASVKHARYCDMWEMAMGLYIAHFITLYLQTMANTDMPTQAIVNQGLAKGLQTSKSVGDVSVSYDFNTVAQDFDGWGTYKLTLFGQQFITMAKLVSMGGMVVW